MTAEAAVNKAARKRFRLAIILAAPTFIIYCASILPVAFDREPLSILPNPALSLGILPGASVVVSAWILLFICVRWADKHYDRIIAAAARAPVGASWEDVNVSRPSDRITEFLDPPLVSGRLIC